MNSIHAADGSPTELLLEQCGDTGWRVVVDAGGEVLFDLDIHQVDAVIDKLATLRRRMALRVVA